MGLTLVLTESLRRQRQEFARIGAGQVGDRAQHALLPQNVVREAGMSLMWMPPHTTTPPLRTARSAAGTSAPTGAKMIAASSACGGVASEPPAHTAPRLRANPALAGRRAG